MEESTILGSDNEALVIEYSKQLEDHHVEVLFKSQCMKSQIYICNQLQVVAKHLEQKSETLWKENIKLRTEIALAEEDINSALKALKAIKDANGQKNITNLTKNVEERIDNGIKKYETLWQRSEKQYETIPIVHYCLVVRKKKDATQESTASLINEEKQLKLKILKLEKEEFELAKKRLIQLANYFVHERPKIIRQIKEKQNELIEMKREMEKLSWRFGGSRILKYGSRIEKVTPNKGDSKEVKVSWQRFSNDIKDNNVMPQLQFNTQNIKTQPSDELLNQLKTNQSQSTVTRFDTKDISKEQLQISKPYEINKNVYISTLLNNYNTEKSDDYEADKNTKSIRILQDLKLDNTQAYEILSKAKGNSLQEVNMIGKDARINKPNNMPLVKEKPVKTVEIKEILEVPSNEEQTPEILLPPTQYKDQSNSQNSQQKRVTFDDGVVIRNFETMDPDKSVKNDSIDSESHASLASELSYSTMKDVVLKKHNFDITPPFVYSKNTITSMKPENKIVTSKFFDSKNIAENKDEKNKVNDEPMETNFKGDDDNKIITDNTETTQATQNNLTGFLFNHNERGIDREISMDYDDADGEMPSFINTSLLLSPKADDPAPSTNDPVPTNSDNIQKPQMFNFFSGFKNNRSSFFEAPTFQDKSEEPSKDENKMFSFSFGGDKKKASGGFFNFFN